MATNIVKIEIADLEPVKQKFIDAAHEIERLTAEVQRLTSLVPFAFYEGFKAADIPTHTYVDDAFDAAAPVIRACHKDAPDSGRHDPLPGRKDVKGILSDDPSRRPASADSKQKGSNDDS